MSPTAAAAISSSYLKDLIAAGHLPAEFSYLAVDPSKMVRARKAAMKDAVLTDEAKHEGEKIVGMSYDGRRDKRTRAMVPDSFGKMRMRVITEEHESVTEEPSGQYLAHFTPEPPVHPEKPAEKVAEALYELLLKHDSTESLMLLGGDSCNTNTGYKGGTHAHLERKLGRRLFWAICNLHTNELVLRHLIVALDGPTSSDTGFTGPVCSLLSGVSEMPFNPKFRGISGGEDLVSLPGDVVKNMSTDQKACYKLVQAVKAGKLPPELQDMKCGRICHARWLTTAECIIFMWTREHGLTGKNLKLLRLLVKFCLEVYFPLYFAIKHSIVDAPYHILTSLRILRTQPKCVKDVITFYVRKGAWYAHPECLLLSLLASSNSQDRLFAVNQILKLRNGDEYGDNSVRPRVTPKLNLSATSLTNLISWKEDEVQEPAFTCSITTAEIQTFVETPYKPPLFSSHTQSTERFPSITFHNKCNITVVNETM